MQSLHHKSAGSAFFDLLMARTAKARNDFANLPKVLSIQAIGMSRDKYRGFLEQLYHLVWHFCPVLSAAAARLGDDRRSLRMAIWREIEEEQGHELWVEQDYVAAGGRADTLKQSEPAIPVQALIGYNYFVAERKPAGVFGMRFALEMIANDFAGDAVEAIAAATGLARTEATGFRFLLAHAEKDAQHVRELSVLLNDVTHPEDQRAIIAATEVNYHLFAELVDD
jgi:pyrroloquinoline quinone (PQQ) biosynthesis protein C